MGKEEFPTAADMITLGRVVLGVVAIWLAVGETPFAAAPLLIVCMVLDGLDGEVARRFGSSGDVGHRLDAAADLLCFCFAPSVFIYRMGGGTGVPEGLNDPAVFPLVVALAVLVFGTVRLARFVKEEQDAPHFSGLPTAALALLAICLMHPALEEVFPLKMTLVLTGLLAPVMLTGLPYPKLTGFSGLVAMILFLTVAVDSALHVWGPGMVLGGAGVVLLLLAIGPYVFLGPLLVRPMDDGPLAEKKDVTGPEGRT